MTGLAMSATWMVEDGVIKVGGAELGQAILMLLQDQVDIYLVARDHEL